MAKKRLIEVDGSEVAVSHVEKVFFAESGFTEGAVIKFSWAEIFAVPPSDDINFVLYKEGVKRTRRSGRYDEVVRTSTRLAME